MLRTTLALLALTLAVPAMAGDRDGPRSGADRGDRTHASARGDRARRDDDSSSRDDDRYHGRRDDDSASDDRRYRDDRHRSYDTRQATRHAGVHHRPAPIRTVQHTRTYDSSHRTHRAHDRPWSQDWHPSNRPGYRWTAGYWSNGHWSPGVWRPVSQYRPGQVWVDGYWDGRYWVDGYWRPAYRAGYVWVDGRYSRHGVWIGGSWQVARSHRGHGQYRYR